MTQSLGLLGSSSSRSGVCTPDGSAEEISLDGVRGVSATEGVRGVGGVCTPDPGVLGMDPCAPRLSDAKSSPCGPSTPSSGGVPQPPASPSSSESSRKASMDACALVEDFKRTIASRCSNPPPVEVRLVGSFMVPRMLPTCCRLPGATEAKLCEVCCCINGTYGCGGSSSGASSGVDASIPLPAFSPDRGRTTTGSVNRFFGGANSRWLVPAPKPESLRNMAPTTGKLLA
mmetsp:Transcript_22148/g.53874  ORF Transcript_22148/g.53874 Transcript_22148/m.53874 type:complete len:230 (+) Transcript_22148:136-825(+)